VYTHQPTQITHPPNNNLDYRDAVTYAFAFAFLSVIPSGNLLLLLPLPLQVLRRHPERSEGPPYLSLPLLLPLPLPFFDNF